jgi:hypothetical protein
MASGAPNPSVELQILDVHFSTSGATFKNKNLLPHIGVSTPGRLQRFLKTICPTG